MRPPSSQLFTLAALSACAGVLSAGEELGKALASAASSASGRPALRLFGVDIRKEPAVARQTGSSAVPLSSPSALSAQLEHDVATTSGHSSPPGVSAQRTASHKAKAQRDWRASLPPSVGVLRRLDDSVTWSEINDLTRRPETVSQIIVPQRLPRQPSLRERVAEAFGPPATAHLSAEQREQRIDVLMAPVQKIREKRDELRRTIDVLRARQKRGELDPEGHVTLRRSEAHATKLQDVLRRDSWHASGWGKVARLEDFLERKKAHLLTLDRESFEYRRARIRLERHQAKLHSARENLKSELGAKEDRPSEHPDALKP